MDVFDLSAKLTLDSSNYERGLGQAEQRASVFGGVLKGNLATAAITKGLDLVASAAQKAAEGIYNLIRSSVSAYSEYEQLVGGVRKLYGNMGLSLEEYAQQQGKAVSDVQVEWETLEKAQNLVLENAKNAYKTAGMSMNQYMETATSFSAALITSLGGDTVAAAELTDVAMQNISDNLNTFGGDIGMIKNAFMGFAKQNYTMLDNLKLGYGGTKTEMERLIEDANEYAATIGESSDLTIEKFSDVVKAIDLIQQKQQIRGTTAREAEATIQGSISMTKAAWENLITSIGTGEGTDEAFDAFVSSLENTINNIVPVVERVIPIVGNVIEKILPLVKEFLPLLLDEIMPLVIDAVKIIGGAILRLLGELYIEFGEFLDEKIYELVQWFVENNPLVSGVIKVITAIIVEVTKFIATLIKLFISAREAIEEAWSNVKTFWSGVWENIKSAFSNADTWLGEKFGVGWESVKSIWSLAGDYFNAVWETIKGVFSVVGDVLTGDFRGAWEGIKGIVGTWGDYFRNVWETIKNVFSNVAQLGIDIVRGLWDGIVQGSQWLYDKLFGWTENVKGFLKGRFDINSPSGWARDVIGRNIGLGMAVGIEDSESSVNNAMRMLFDGVNRLEIPEPEFDYSASVVSASQSQFDYGGDSMLSDMSRVLSGGYERTGRDLTVILELDSVQLGRAVYRLNEEETQRVGVKLAGGFA